MNDGLSQHDAKPLTGKEPFRGHKVMPPLQLIDFWRWSGSMLSDNTTRGILAEFIVAAALGLREKIRRAWDECDIRMPSNTSVEVKSAAHYQAWEQDKPSTIQFHIAPRGRWNPETGKFTEQKRRWADIFVFCVFEGENCLDCLDMNKWDFYVIATRVLDQEVPQQVTIGLRSLIKLSPHKCSFEDLQKVILDVEKEIKENLPSPL